MKKLLLHSIAILFITKINAQQYFHFPDTNAVWRCLDNVQISISGSVTRNNKVYKKYVGSHSDALLREDTITKKVYILSEQDTTQENLLYDFSLQANQTTTVYPFHEGWAKVKVQSIDNILIGNNYHKRFKIVNPDLMFQEFDIFQEYWIEGIGSTSGVLFSGESTIPLYDACHNTLLCYEQNSSILYNDTHYNSCTAICYDGVGIKENYLNKINLSVYPNPADKILNVELEIQNENLKIKIVNVLGKELKVERLELKDGKSEIDLSQFQAGIYFLQVFEKGNLVAVQKIVKE